MNSTATPITPQAQPATILNRGKYEPLSNVFEILSAGYRPCGNLYLAEMTGKQREKLASEAQDSVQDSLSALRSLSALMFWVDALEEAPPYKEFMNGLAHATRILTESAEISFDALDAVDTTEMMERNRSSKGAKA